MRNFVAFGFLICAWAIVVHCNNVTQNEKRQANEMWIASIEHGISSFHSTPNGYPVFRNVMDYGCRGDGVTDDTACINLAISSGGRCGENCGSSTITPALVYVPSGNYVVSSPIIMHYFTQLVGNANNPPHLIAAPNFSGMAVIDSNPYGDGGNNWYINQNNFFRQVRNFVIDLTRTPYNTATTGIHWQVAQATSLFKIRFVMSRQIGTLHQGIFMENGSGGFMSDLRFEGGRFGMWVGNQQFLSRNLEFESCDTAIYMSWNWQWTFKGITITNCRIGIDMSSIGEGINSGVGSILLMDSDIVNTPTGVIMRAYPSPSAADTSGTLLLDNVRINGVPRTVFDVNGQTILGLTGQQTIVAWGRGSRYYNDNGANSFHMDFIPGVQKSSVLLDGQGNFYAKSRPQYEELSVNDFVSVKSAGARGDGVTDDSDAIQAVLNANINGRVVYFPAGSYVIGKTVTVRPGVRIIGELWSVLMAGGSAFQNANNPQPMLKVGEPGDAGLVEITDLFFSSKGAQPGAILVQWNIRQTYQGSASMWDSHFRVGGFQGSNLQFPQCPRGQGAVPQCNGVHTLLQVTSTGSGYFENIWAWTADHDLDDGIAQSQISIYTGRGVLIESSDGPVWLYGTQSEHNVFSQYQLSQTSNVFLTMIQSETPYWQPGPPAPQPYLANPIFNDPGYSHCAAGDVRCPMSYAIRARNSSNIYVYGAGMYNFFNNYDQTCLSTEDCQNSMVSLEGNRRFYMFNVNTKAAINMVVKGDTKVLARSNDNRNGFCQTINAFLTQSS